VFDTISADELLAPRTLPQIEAVSTTCVAQLAGHWPTPLGGPDGGPTMAERRAFWASMQEKYKSPR
jgi:hypothetical protein